MRAFIAVAAGSSILTLSGCTAETRSVEVARLSDEDTGATTGGDRRGVGDSANGDDRRGDERSGDPRSGDPRQGDAWHGDTRQGDAWNGDAWNGDSSNGDARQGDDFAVIATMESVYPGHADWNDYVKNDGSGDACVNTDPGLPRTCLHGGELRRVVVSGLTSCTDLTATDALDVFGWICDDSTGSVVFTSTGLKRGRRLVSLLNTSGFMSNSVEISQGGTPLAATAETTWWNNPVLPLLDNSTLGDGVVELDQAETVYVLGSTRASDGYNITADRISVVTMPGATLSLTEGAADNCNLATGDTTDPATGSKLDYREALLCSGNRSFLWIEGEYDGRSGAPESGASDYQTAMILVNTHRSVLRYVTVQNGGYGLLFMGGNGSQIAGFVVSNVSHYGIILGAAESVLAGILISNTGTEASSGNAGFLMQSGSTGNIITRMMVVSAADYGVLQYGTGADANHQNTWSHVTAIGSANTAFSLGETTNSTYAHVVSVNSGVDGFTLNAVADSKFAHLVSAHNGADGFYMAGVTGNNLFSGDVLVGSNGSSDCSFAGTCVPPIGLDDTAGLCANDPPSIATVTSGIDLSGSLVGAVTSDSNPSHTAGTANATTILDWLHFDSAFRTWGINGASILDPALRVRCVTDEPTNCPGPCVCQIWDWRLSSGDTVLLERNGLFASPTCPVSVHGDEYLTDYLGNTFLLNALEILFDGIGDEDGLCESGEDCLYSPNIGAYQGAGDYTSNRCAITDGTVTGVTIYGYPVNGI